MDVEIHRRRMLVAVDEATFRDALVVVANATDGVTHYAWMSVVPEDQEEHEEILGLFESMARTAALRGLREATATVGD